MAVDPEKTSSMPRHIAIVMDGNGRWAKRRFLPRNVGHRQGVEALREIIQTCKDLGVSYLSVYVFSTENWRRPDQEVGFLMDLIGHFIEREMVGLKKNGARVKIFGRTHLLPEILQQKIARLESETAANTDIQFNLLINYGGRAEIVDATQAIVAAALQGKLRPSDIDDSCIEKYLYTAGVPDPDLLIRTGGDYRISNFLLWQIAYSELYVTPILWPDFNKEALNEAILAYQTRVRRFGGVHEK